MDRIKISDIATALGLSKTTISKALNGYKDVNALTRKRVLDYVNEVQFIPNRQASFLRTKETKTIALILPQINHDFFNTIIDGILFNVQKSDYTLFVACSNDSFETEKKLVDQYLNLNVDAIFISITNDTKSFDHLEAVKERNKILVMFDKNEKTFQCPKVMIEDRKAGFLATEHLIKRGCKQILHFRGAYQPQITIDRFLGYKDALEKYHIPFDQKKIILCENGYEKEGYHAAKKVFEMGIQFDGLFAVTDLSAIGAIQFFKSQKIKIPDEVSVVGFGNWRLSKFTVPSITSVDQAGIEMGKQIFDVFLNETSLRKKGEDINANKIINIKSKLITRESSSR